MSDKIHKNATIIAGVITAFPRFTPITLDILAEFNQHIAPHPPYSDFNFVNLMSWNRRDGGGVALLADNLVLLYPSYVDDKDFFLSFIGTRQLDHTVRTLLGFAEQTLPASKLQLVPELAVAPLRAAGTWRIIEDSDNHDYVISLAALSKSDGHELRRFRRATRAFCREHGSHAQLRSLDLTNPVTQQAVIGRFVEREAEKPSNESAYELAAIQQLLRHAHHFPLLSYGITLDGVLQAFIICEDVGRGWSIGHFWKADISYKGIYSYLMHEVAKQLTSIGITMMNIQQDLGIASLRFFKSSFNPIARLKKFTIEPGATAQREILGAQLGGAYQRPSTNALPAG